MRREEDWKEFLTEDARKVLAELIDAAKKHRAAYQQADDTKIAQVWSALIEIRKDLQETRELINKLVFPWKAIVEAGEAQKRKTIERIVTEIIKPTEAEREVVKRLVDSLMKF
jgi:flagellar hook-basal body complex protein FliE